MDQVKRCRSFQDVGQTYSEVAQRVASGHPNGAVIPTVGLDKPLGVPVIQYRETDWEFLKRMASWCLPPHLVWVPGAFLRLYLPGGLLHHRHQSAVL